ncbi:MAG: sel1 repeat family protein [Candidatus Methanomethylophilaceae archaeon]|nr:sel1 repeat family protein [Candidatus Methanomethylophilaceae archaeon]
MEDTYKAIGPEKFQQVANFFKVPPVDGPCTFMLMTSSFFLKDEYASKFKETMSWEEMYLYPYRVLADHLTVKGTRLVIKAHPNTRISRGAMESYFPGEAYIPGYVPSDILRFIDFDIRMGMSPGSNSISTMDIRNKVTLPRSYFKCFELLDWVPVLSELSEHMGLLGMDITKYAPKEVVDGLEIIFKDVNIRNGELKLISSLSKCSPKDLESKKLMVRLGTADEFDMSELPEGDLVYIRRELLDRCSVFDPEPVYFLLINTGGRSIDFSYRFFGKYTRTVVESSWRSRYELSRDSKNHESDRTVRYANLGNTLSLMKLSKMYYSGSNGFEKDAGKAIALMREAAEDPCTVKPGRELVRILWKEGTDDELMLSTLRSLKNDAGFSNYYIGRMYRTGRGLEKDPERSVSCLRKAYDCGIKGASKEFFDAIWQAENPLYDKEHEVATSSAEEDPEMTARLGSMLYYGRGVGEDREKGASMLKEAARNGVKWAQKEVAKLKLDG